MTREEKELLLKDLCVRAQYKVNIHVLKGARIHDNGKIKESDLIDTVYGVIFYNDEPRIVTPQNFSFLDRNGIRNFGGWTVEEVRPYLRPMSSMTEEEKKELKQEHVKDEKLYAECLTRAAKGDNSLRGKVIIHYAADWCNKNHFDYRGLIPMGLALEAPENMYKTEE